MEAVQNSYQLLQLYYQDNPWITIGGYFLIYIAITALAIPSAGPMALLAGAVFGLVGGTVVVSFASTIGASLTFLFSRSLLRNYLEKKFPRQLEIINRGVERSGAWYLLSLRLFPAFPFFLINILMGLTRMKLRPFFFVSQVGMLGGTILFVNAGEKLSQINSMKEVLSFKVVFAFALLALLPLIAKEIFKRFR